MGQMPGKAMVVAMSGEICVHLYNEIVALHPEWHDEERRNKSHHDRQRFGQSLATSTHLLKSDQEAPGKTL
jgi:type I site-specific restriction-modification system R (restriction) subunit